MDVKGKILAGKYQLLEKAGRGGMAVVWRAHTLGAAGFTRPVAIKRLMPHLAAAKEFIDMFVEEARVVSYLQHPNIAQIHDFDSDAEGQHFLVMEWVEGVDMRSFVHCYVANDQPTPWPVVTSIMIEVLRALGAAHLRVTPDGQPSPVFHRDVTPGNVLVCVEGYVKLTDFGVARAMDRATVTHPDEFKGKLTYTAPEITKAMPATPETDLYSVGIVLWEALTGQQLYADKSDMEIIWAINKVPIPDVREYRTDIPDGLAKIVAKAISKEPEHRFPSCKDMARALAGVLRNVDRPPTAEDIASEVAHVRFALGISDSRDEFSLRTEIAESPQSFLRHHMFGDGGDKGGGHGQ